MTAVVRAEQDSRLDRLAAEYAQLKPAVDAQTKRLKEVTEAIKVELVNTAPGETHVVLHADVLDNPLQLLAKEGWRLDTVRFKKEQLELYVRYARKSTTWELRSVGA